MSRFAGQLQFWNPAIREVSPIDMNTGLCRHSAGSMFINAAVAPIRPHCQEGVRLQALHQEMVVPALEIQISHKTGSQNKVD